MENSLQQSFTGIPPSMANFNSNSQPPPPGDTGTPPPEIPGPQRKFSKKLSAFLILLVLTTGGALVLSQTGVRQIITGNAWYTARSAYASCTPLGTVAINFSFTNKESSRAMLVVAKDTQTGLSSDMGKILAGQTKTGKISTTRTSLSSGYVTFKMAWADNTSSTDTVSAQYSSIQTCPKPTSTPTPRPTNTPTPRPTGTPAPKPTATPTPKPTAAPTPRPTNTPTPTRPAPTVTNCPTPGTVKNIQIKCPYCTPSPIID